MREVTSKSGATHKSGTSSSVNALDGLRVLDLATLYAGPLASVILGDFGAEVIKVEHPRGDPIRRHGPRKNGVGLAAKVLNRNKRCITLDLSRPEGQSLLVRLASVCDVLIESFRPGTLERWNIGPAVLHEVNPGLIIARVSGFGQIGPARERPGFGTLAEAMSGFAATNGAPDGPPTLPPFPLADSVTGLATAFAVLTGISARRQTGRGQVIDLSLIEPFLAMLGPQHTWFQQLGYVQPRRGNRSGNTAPRNLYRTSDDKWVALSSSTTSIARRVMRVVGRGDLAEAPWFETGQGRVEHVEEIDEAVGHWIVQRSRDQVLALLQDAQAAVAPVYDASDHFDDPQLRALETIIEVPDEELGPLAMQNVMFRMAETPGRVRWSGRRLGVDNLEIYRNLLRLSDEDLERLRKDNVI